ncbi:MAG: NADP-dependent phosphogluconate dehydrogenase [Phycisphaerales bacterium]|nr:NADP-dependent phosphogluconate dehydrogenase [Phycisphaerales bacterium]MCB9863190.1 NADP-dependent phosphogluconate dehydrogenase [Phycisphaerales bacterium]
MEIREHDIGMVGLGVMGRNVLLNMLDHGFSTAGLDTDAAKARALVDEAKEKPASATTDPKAFVAMLRKPRAIMMLVPAGAPVDAVIRELAPMLSPDDLLIDAGNSHFTDTNRRVESLAKQRIHFFGMGISGGESGARHGPSMMPGGSREAYERVRPILESIAADVDGEPCVTYLGPGSAGHYVKMVHNGIEYGLMQLIAESYDLLKRGVGLSNQELADVFERWNEGALSSFLIEITSMIFRQKDVQSDNSLIDMILGVARQKGTGQWTSQDALALKVPTPTIDIAVGLRDLSGREDVRHAANRILRGPAPTGDFSRDAVNQVHDALHASTILTYAQGMAQLQAASKAYGYDLNMEAIARIWRGGCIIRSALLEEIRVAYKANDELSDLIVAPNMAERLSSLQAALRTVVAQGVERGIPIAGFMACLAYFDAYRSDWMPFNLIQAQRDYFGAHTYERIDQKGVFHTQWGEPLPQSE